MQITKDTRVSVIPLKYGDIAEVMETFGVQRVEHYSLRMFLAKALIVGGLAAGVAYVVGALLKGIGG